jgi:hypothetical protein
MRPYVGCDGEGINRNGVHEYVMLRVGEDILIHNDLSRLSTDEILWWLTSARIAGQERIAVSFGFNYDVAMILKDLPANTLALLCDFKGRLYPESDPRHGRRKPVYYGRYQLEYYQGKRFTIVNTTTKRRMVIHDTLGFFQSSFLAALTTWNIGTEVERAEIKRMKELRSTFDGSEQEIAYNRQECIFLAQMMTDMRDVAMGLGYGLGQNEGAGNLAQEILKAHNAPTKDDIQHFDDWLVKCATAAYYGGRFEVSRIGPLGTVHEYDIASAYPSAMVGLPCLKHGQWVQDEWFHTENQREPQAQVRLYYVYYKAKKGAKWGPFPHRDPNGRILYPSRGYGWYWHFEVDAAIRHGHKVEIRAAWSYMQVCDEQPFRWVDDLYGERKSHGKSAPEYKMLKLGMNSLYGKTAQSIGNPKYSNPVYAGLITSAVRARMMNVCEAYPDDVVMIATDGIYLTCEMESDTTIIEDTSGHAGLGDWEHAMLDDLFIIKPGMYFTKDGKAKVKSRGISRLKLERQIGEFVSQWSERGIMASVPITYTFFHGARYSCHTNTIDRMGEWEERTTLVSFKSNLFKRDWNLGPSETYSDVVSSLWERDVESTPYEKNFGMEILTEFDEASLLDDTPFDEWEVD